MEKKKDLGNQKEADTEFLVRLALDNVKEGFARYDRIQSRAYTFMGILVLGLGYSITQLKDFDIGSVLFWGFVLMTICILFAIYFLFEATRNRKLNNMDHIPSFYLPKGKRTSCGKLIKECEEIAKHNNSIISEVVHKLDMARGAIITGAGGLISSFLFHRIILSFALELGAGG